ncbi:MAG: hypothetical protein HYX96_06860 [Chloroflexi bacterium]|nr:hypothetical protein [Chloroflexota bacterium]
MKVRLVSVLLVTLALALLVPAPALAAKPVISAKPVATEFAATATIDAITPGDVSPLGNTGNWLVRNREIQGEIAGSINGAFTITYKGIFELATQAGTFSGSFESGAYRMQIAGVSAPLQIVWVEEFQTYLPMLQISGQWLLPQQQGYGEFNGWAIFIPVDGHVGAIVASSLGVTGVWKP